MELSAQVPLIHMSLGLTPLYRKLEFITMFMKEMLLAPMPVYVLRQI